MKLLFDENVSWRLIRLLEDRFPESSHVDQLGLSGRTDHEVWEVARTGGFLLVSKDGDLRQRAFALGAPPKVLWLSVGNAGTDAIAALLRAQAGRIMVFAVHERETILILTFGDRR